MALRIQSCLSLLRQSSLVGRSKEINAQLTNASKSKPKGYLRSWPKPEARTLRSMASEASSSEWADDTETAFRRSPTMRTHVARGMSTWVREQAALKVRLHKAEQKLIDLALELSNREAARIRAEDEHLLNEQREKGLVMQPSPFEYFGTYVSYEKTQPLHDRARPVNAWSILLTITGLNVLVYLLCEWASGAPPQPDGTPPPEHRLLTDHFIGTERNLNEGRWWTALSSTFVHADLGHLSGNLFALWLFGFKVAQSLGPARFWALYLTGGALATFGELYSGFLRTTLRKWAREFISTEQIESTEQKPIEEEQPKGVVGASGSVMAVSAAAMVLFPSDCIRVQIPSLTIILPMAVSFYMVSDVYGVLTPGSQVAHFAHLTGAIGGMAMTSVFWMSSKRVPPNTLLPVVRYLWDGITKAKVPQSGAKQST